MFLKFNQFLFADLIFSAKTSMFAALIASLLAIFTPHPLMMNVILFIIVFFTCFTCCFLAFLISSQLRQYTWPNSPRAESFIILILAAISANVLGIVILEAYFAPFNFIIYGTTALTIFVGSKFYLKTWSDLRELIAQGD